MSELVISALISLVGMTVVGLLTYLGVQKQAAAQIAAARADLEAQMQRQAQEDAHGKEKRFDDLTERMRSALLEENERLTRRVSVLEHTVEEQTDRIDSQQRLIQRLRNQVSDLGGEWVGEERRRGSAIPPGGQERRGV